MFDNKVVKSTTVWSADGMYLFQGVVGIIFAIAIEIMSVREFFVSPLSEALGLALIMQLVVGLCLLLTVSLGAYKRKAQFVLYFCKIDDADIKGLKEKYHLCFVDEYGVLFVDKKDESLFDDWKLMRSFYSMRVIERQLFTSTHFIPNEE